jgi:hypothetical protein
MEEQERRREGEGKGLEEGEQGKRDRGEEKGRQWVGGRRNFERERE